MCLVKPAWVSLRRTLGPLKFAVLKVMLFFVPLGKITISWGRGSTFCWTHRAELHQLSCNSCTGTRYVSITLLVNFVLRCAFFSVVFELATLTCVCLVLRIIIPTPLMLGFTFSPGMRRFFCQMHRVDSGVVHSAARPFNVWELHIYLEPQTTIYNWLFQLDDSQSLHRKWLFHQTSIYL